MREGFSCHSSHFAAPIFLICATLAEVGPQLARRARCTAGVSARTVGGCFTVTATGFGALPAAVVWYSTFAVRVVPAGGAAGGGLARLLGLAPRVRGAPSRSGSP